MSTERRPYRRHSIFILNESIYASKLDRNDRAKIIRAAEGLERATKKPGKRGGALGYVGITVLRALLYRFSSSGRITAPSYTALMQHTGLCRQAVRDGLKRLQASGLLTTVRRIKRQTIERVSGVTGLLESFVGTVQAANVYLLKLPRLLSVAPVRRKEGKPSLQCRQNIETEVQLFSIKEVVAEATSYSSIMSRRIAAGLR